MWRRRKTQGGKAYGTRARMKRQSGKTSLPASDCVASFYVTCSGSRGASRRTNRRLVQARRRLHAGGSATPGASLCAAGQTLPPPVKNCLEFVDSRSGCVRVVPDWSGSLENARSSVSLERGCDRSVDDPRLRDVFHRSPSSLSRPHSLPRLWVGNLLPGMWQQPIEAETDLEGGTVDEDQGLRQLLSTSNCGIFRERTRALLRHPVLHLLRFVARPQGRSRVEMTAVNLTGVAGWTIR